MCLVFQLIVCVALFKEAACCAYGPGCRFPCRCGTRGCDSITGNCISGSCEEVLPNGHSFGWTSSGCRIGNVAYGKPAVQSGQYDDNTAARAVDGNTDSRLAWGDSCAHPWLSQERQAWWAVDLEKIHVIEKIVIFNRNRHQDRTNDFNIRIGDSSVISRQDLCIYYNDGAKDKLTLTCTEPKMKGRYISMERREGSHDQNEINICEFVVIGYEPMDCYENCDGKCDTLTGCDICKLGFALPDCIDGCKPDTWGTNCLQICGECRDNQQCNIATGICENGCEKWFVNERCDTHIVVPSLRDKQVVVDEISSTSLKVTWPQDEAVQNKLEEYYFYRVLFEPIDGKTIQSEKVGHDSNTAYQSLGMKGLAYNTEYRIVVVPYRMYEDLEEAGDPSFEGQSKTLCIVPTEPTLIVTISNETWIIHIQDIYDIERGCDAITSYEFYIGSSDGENIIYTQSVLEQSEVLIHFNISLNAYLVWTMVSNNENLAANSTSTTLLLNIPGDNGHVSYLPLILGCGIGIFIVILIFIILIFIRAKRRKMLKSNSPDIVPISNTEDLTRQGSINMSIMKGTDNVYANTENLDFPTTCIPVSQLELYIQQKQNEADGFKHEYSTIPEGAVHPVTKASEGNNLIKNRFKNIKAYDKTRVVLDIQNDNPSTDYINACFIPGYNGNAEYYIAGQGPVPHTISDTWRMIWQYNITRIVMVTKEKELGKQKCERYWPKSVGEIEEYGSLAVTLCEVENYTDFTIRKITCSDLSETKRIIQFHFTSWPDKQALDMALPLLQFRHKVKSYPEEGPLFVHCSAGIGRTGTYIALDYLLDEGLCAGKMDVHRCVTHMRECRMNMVQTLAQYESIYKALLEAFTFGDPIQCAELDARLEQMGPEIVKQHQNITKWTGILISSDSNNDGFTSENKMKNRDKEIIPDDAHRPYLKTPWKDSNDYINAVLINSYRRTNAYIVTQFPLPSTTADFWRLVYDHKCGVIVTLGQLETQENSESNTAIYYNFANVNSTSWWPEHKHKPVQYGPIDVTTKNTVPEKGLSIRTYDVQLTGNKDSVSTSHITLSDWSNDNLPQLDVFIELLKEIEQQMLKKDGPVLVQCLNGVDKSGLLVAALYMTEYMKLEQQVDVVNAVRSVRRYRKQFVNDQNQFEFLYKVAQLYNKMFSTYANIM